MSRSPDEFLATVVARLRAAGCVAAEEEAEEILAAGRGNDVMALVERRCTGEPLAWVTGTTTFCGLPIHVGRGVYVPRWQSEPLAERAAAVLTQRGRAIDVATGCGAIARVLMERRPHASVLGTEVDALAIDCARRNGVTVAQGDLFTGVPEDWAATVAVIVGVLPYVPTGQIGFLARDVRDFEPRRALDGGSDGLQLIRRVVAESTRWLREGGHLLLEIGGDQPDLLIPLLQAAGFETITVVRDGDGDPRGLAAALPSPVSLAID